MGRVDLIYSLKSGNKSKSRRLTYVNPAVDDSVLAEVAAALAGLSENDLYEAYRVEQEDLNMAEMSTPHLKLENVIYIPDTLVAEWQGGGEMSVSLQNDIADYTVQGNQVIFDLKDEHDTGTFTSDALIIIGENGDYQSDSAQFTLTADYSDAPVTIQPAKRSPYLKYNPYIYNNSTYDTIYWQGGDLSIDVPASNYCSVSMGAATLNSTGKAQRVYYAQKKTPAKGTAILDEVTIRVAESARYTAKTVIQTVATAQLSDRVTIVGDNRDSVKSITTYDTTRASQDDNFTNYGDCCSIFSSSGNDSITNYGNGCTIQSSSGLDTINNYGVGCKVSLYGSLKSVYNEGDACSLNANSTVNATNAGGNCTILAAIASSNINNSGDCCYIRTMQERCTITNSGDNAVFNLGSTYNSVVSSGDYCSLAGGGYSTINVSGDNCTIYPALGQRIDCNGKDIILNFYPSVGNISMYGAGAHSTLVLPKSGNTYMPTVSGDNFILKKTSSNSTYGITLFGGAAADYVYEVV